MDISEENYNPNPREKANPFSVLLFGYTIGMFRKGCRKVLDVNDLYNPIKNDRSEKLGDRLQKKWEVHLQQVNAKKCKKYSLLKVIFKTFWPEYLTLGCIITLMELVLRLSQPFMLGKLLDYFRLDTTTTKEEAMYYAGAMIAINALSALSINQYIFCGYHYGMRVRAACCSLIYRKALKLSKTGLGDTASGKIVNLLSNDVSRFDLASIVMHHMWTSPVSAIIITGILIESAGIAGVVGMIPIFAVAIFQTWTGKLSAKYRRQTAYKTDERVRMMDEIISGIQVIKMYAWEKPFEKLIQLARKKEINEVTKLSYVRGIFMTFNLFTTRLALFGTLLTISLTENESITAARVFVIMAYFNILSQTMSTMFVRGVSEVAEMLVAVKRLQDFLLSDEFVDTSFCSNNTTLAPQETALALKNVCAKANPNKDELILDKFCMNLQAGKLLGVIGPVGSGKSSLLQTLLGELHIVSGDIVVNGTLSYCAQEPWVFAATVRQNILFGQEYDKKRYNEVVRVCALETDFKQFEQGDLTEVGERGTSLSGGQKARINLARAVYRNADIYLLDDPLSAVDIHVAKHLFNDCIRGFLANKTRILVTHQVHHLKKADNIIILNKGTIELQGTFNELARNTEVHYSKLLREDPEKALESATSETDVSKLKLLRQISGRSKTTSVSSLQSELSSVYEENEEQDESDIKTKNRFEDSSKGKVKGNLFLKYHLSGGNCFFVFIVFALYILAQAAASSVDFFVSYWTNLEEFRNDSFIYNATELIEFYENGSQKLTRQFCIYIYAALIIALFLFAFSRSMLFYKLAMLASKNLHNGMFRSVVYSSMQFFDNNPSGRILNRFSKDIGSIDELLPKAILDAGQMILTMFGSIILVAVVNPWLLVPIAVIGIVFYGLRIIYLKTSKNIKRLEGMMRSPVFTHLNATIQGLSTIRAYRAEHILRKEFDKHQDLHTSAWYMFIAASSAYGFFLDVLCFIFTGIVTFSFLTFGSTMLGGNVGLAITQAAALTGLLQWGMRQSAEVANQLMSVERILEYSIIEPEKQPLVPKVPNKEWPDKGLIKFKDLKLRYAQNLPLVLKGLDLTIMPKEKVGIVGRTGAGKSSLIAALFRLAELEGSIVIDDIDTESVNLQYLRSKISIIPQDPVLFSGTLRYNLDPFGEYPDEVLWRAIEDVELKDPSNIINRLDNQVSDGGSNYSVGQRQLICLARAIVRKNKILMLDEATANVDPQTDALIQKTIRLKFSECTVLTVAHRLNTIMDSDKVAVMDSGQVVEFDHPHILLQNNNGKFHHMVMSTGKPLCDQLKRIAQDAYNKLYGISPLDVPE